MSQFFYSLTFISSLFKYETGKIVINTYCKYINMHVIFSVILRTCNPTINFKHSIRKIKESISYLLWARIRILAYWIIHHIFVHVEKQNKIQTFGWHIDKNAFKPCLRFIIMRQKSHREIGDDGIFFKTLTHAMIRFAYGHRWFHFAFKYDDISISHTFERLSGKIISLK